MTAPLQLTGQRFGRLVVIERVQNNIHQKTMWRCQCDCGNEVCVIGSRLKNGLTLSCGCLQKETAKQTLFIHGETSTRLHSIWKDMKRRCYNPRRKEWADYGGRGIDVCAEWKESYMKFRDWALANGYNDNLSLDRVNNDRGYSPENCRWATNIQQAENKRNNITVEYDGREQCLGAWVREFGYSYGQCRWYVVERGWSWSDVINFMEKKGLHGT